MRKEEVRVLVVDDDEDIRDTLRLFLETDGYTVLTVGAGAEAVQASEEFRPSCVLVDLGMPGIDGAEVTRRLRSNIGSWLVIIGVTGTSLESEHARLESAGVDFVLTKPVDPAYLRRFLPPLH